MQHPQLLGPIQTLVDWAVVTLPTNLTSLEVFTSTPGVPVFVGRRLRNDPDPDVMILPQSDDEWSRPQRFTTVSDKMAPGLWWRTLNIDEPTLVRSHGNQLWSNHMLLVPSNLGATRRLRAYYDRRSDRYMIINRMEVLFDIKHREAGKLFVAMATKRHAQEIVSRVVRLIEEHGTAKAALLHVIRPDYAVAPLNGARPDQVHADIARCLRAIAYRPHYKR